MFKQLKSLFVTGLVCAALLASGCKEKEYQAVISTEYGDITVLLYNSTYPVLTWTSLSPSQGNRFLTVILMPSSDWIVN